MLTIFNDTLRGYGMLVKRAIGAAVCLHYTDVCDEFT